MKKLKEKFSFDFSGAVLSLGGAWLLACTIMLSIFPQAGVSVAFASNSNIFVFALIAACLFVPAFLFDAYYKKSHPAGYFLTFSLFAFSLVLCVKQNNMITYIFMFVVLLIVLICFDKKCNPVLAHVEMKRKKTLVITVAVVTSVVTAMVCSIGIFRYLSYSAPNYDFGIFCNMFYNMKKSGLPFSTCERDRLLSHFAVHVSPIYYLLLPIYFLFPSPITLAALQPIIVFSGVIPLYLIAKKLGISQNATMFVCVAFALFTPLSSGCFYDLHENCFLVPLLLWLFYFFEKDNRVLTFVFMFLVLLVKEDAFIYVAFFAVYVIVARKKYATGTLMLALGAGYFLFACFMLSKYGTGVMESRYSNLSQSGSLIDAAKTIIINPGYAISQVLKTKTDGLEKVFYIAQLLCPLVFLPLMGKELARYILILPMFINLLTVYTYQYDITFQYTFGICSFLFYLALLNLSDMKKEKQEKLTVVAVLMSLILFSTIVIPKVDTYITKYQAGKENYSKITQALQTIPQDAEVTASTYFVPHLANRDVIYEDEYHDTPTTEYFVLDLRYSVSKGRSKIYVENGYRLIYKLDGILEIYQKQ